MDEELEQTVDALQPHIQELRYRIIYVAVFLFLATGAVFLVSQDLLIWLQTDLALDLNALSAYETIYTQLMLSVLFGFVLVVPFTAYQTLTFLKPGLKPAEYRILRNYTPLFFILFMAGSVFSYEFIVKNSLRFFRQTTAAAGVTAVWGLKDTIMFVLKISSLTGILFQLPIIAAVLSRAGVITAAQMKAHRAYVAVAVLILAAVATPPDLITQVLIATPVIILYQLSIVLVARME